MEQGEKTSAKLIVGLDPAEVRKALDAPVEEGRVSSVPGVATVLVTRPTEIGKAVQAFMELITRELGKGDFIFHVEDLLSVFSNPVPVCEG